mmetsp:Transcript_35548/g.84201  ORF Transcript_35548/g.84201 Transcript_35548/m.84201 type:complete len:274 (-) Transcript_35548:1326-2147(-)
MAPEEEALLSHPIEYSWHTPTRTRSQYCFEWLGRLFGLCVVAVISVWVFVFLGGVGLSPLATDPGVNDTSPIFNWHPLLMSVAVPIFLSEAVVSYRTWGTTGFGPAEPRPRRKALHVSLHAAAVVLMSAAVLAAVKSHTMKLPAPIPNLYSAHSWLGVTALSMLGLQVRPPGSSQRSREAQDMTCQERGALILGVLGPPLLTCGAHDGCCLPLLRPLLGPGHTSSPGGRGMPAAASRHGTASSGAPPTRRHSRRWRPGSRRRPRCFSSGRGLR